MIDAVRRHLPPGAEQWIYFEERADGDPYLLRVFTYEFVDHDPAAVEAGLRAAKPAGLNLIYDTRVGQTWAMLNERKASWEQTRLEYPTWWDVLHDAPPGPGPELTAVTPATGGTAGGTAVTLTGANLTGATELLFAAAPATALTVVDAETATATTPAGAEGPVDVTITTPDGSATLAAGFTYEPPPPGPRLDTVSPASAAAKTAPAIRFAGNFPDPMTGYTGRLLIPGSPERTGAVVKISDTEASATINVGDVLGVGTIGIYNEQVPPAPYTNLLEFEVIPP
jgi:hypothetical protein